MTPKKIKINGNLHKIFYCNVSVNSNWVHPSRATPGDSLKKIARGSGFDFWKLPGGREFDKGRDFVESSNHA